MGKKPHYREPSSVILHTSTVSPVIPSVVGMMGWWLLVTHELGYVPIGTATKSMCHVRGYYYYYF